MSDDQKDERLIQAVLASGVRIPPMPEILLGLNLLLQDEDAGPRELAGLIGRDGALSGAVFRLAGSPVFGLRARVDTVEKAVTVLGIRSAAAIVRTRSCGWPSGRGGRAGRQAAAKRASGTRLSA